MAQPQLSFGLQANVMDQGCCWLNRLDQIDAFPCPDHRLGWIAVCLRFQKQWHYVAGACRKFRQPIAPGADEVVPDGSTRELWRPVAAAQYVERARLGGFAAVTRCKHLFQAVTAERLRRCVEPGAEHCSL